MADKVSIEECRRILGDSAESMTDAEVEGCATTRAHRRSLYTQMVEAGRNGLEAQRWLSYFRETGER